MATKISDPLKKNLHIGDIFTPLKWGKFASKKFSIFDKWMTGKKVFDPTMGNARLLRSLVEYGLKQGIEIKDMPLENLFGNELNTKYFKKALSIFKEKYNINMSKNFSNEDILDYGYKKFDILFGNPPWQNFVDLPNDYKNSIKEYFFKYDLIKNSKNLLLGGSRVDIASLVIQKTIKDNLLRNGEAIFFIPLSILLNDGANEYFRKFKIFDTEYSLDVVYDFNREKIFPDVSTRYGLVHFSKNKKTTYPIPYFLYEGKKFEKQYAKPVKNTMGALCISKSNDSNLFNNIKPILLKKESQPRQGVNSCGANDIFYFDSYTKIDNNLCKVSNKQQKEILLPNEFIYPVATSSNFKEERPVPGKWVLLPYAKNGKILNLEEIEKHTHLFNYLSSHKKKLSSRKGVLINSKIKKGFWWVMLGVGPYNFFKYKIIWEAYGRDTFRPKIFTGRWQANQSLQAFIPLQSKKDANRVVKLLKNRRIEEYLKSSRMSRTMNWAQPGRIKNLIEFEKESPL